MNEKLSIAISCYPTYGGSGVVATEVGIEMAQRGHRVHFVSYDVPKRLTTFLENIFFHEVEVSTYPLFVFPPYTLALASKLVELCESEPIDIIHAHYAIPHAVSAYLAKQILKEKSPKIVTTLHGTDITLVGNDRSYLPITRFSILESDGVTAVSQYLRRATFDKLTIPSRTNIDVIPNFVDTDEYSPCAEKAKKVRGHLCKGLNKDNLPILCHVSNFRPVKRIDDVVEIFCLVKKEFPCRLVLIGDGPERSKIESICKEKGIYGDVCFLGKQESLSHLLVGCDLFLLPSETESFGLAALEAMACGVPVIGTKVGGIPEVIKHGESGFLSELGDVREMADNALMLLRDKRLLQQFGIAARKTAEDRYSKDAIINQYEQLYYRVLGR